MILLIAPHSQKTYGVIDELTAIEPPLWAGMLHKALNSSGYISHIVDQHAEGLSHTKLTERIKLLKPSLIVLVVYGHQPSASTQVMQAAHELLEEMKERDLYFPVMLVGGHPSSLPEESIRNETYSSLYVAKGEGLNVIKGFVDNIDKDKVPGLYRRGPRAIYVPKTKDRKAENLDQTYPGIDWARLPMAKYRAHNWHVLENPSTINSYASIYTSLGCPFRCSFCCINAPFDVSAFRFWKPSFTVSQIEMLVNRYWIKNLKIADEMFVLREDHFMEICRLLIEKKIKVNIWAYARVDTVKDHYLETLKKAGVNWLALGIESGSQAVRDGVTKGRFKMEDIYQTVRKIKEHGINIIGNYIFGLPDDTESSMKETLNLALELNTEFANFYGAMAYPGSPLYLQTPKEDLPESYLGYSQHSYETKPLRTKEVTAARVLEIRDQAHKSYFSNQSYLDMVKRKFGTNGLKLISDMNQKDIKRKLYGVCQTNPPMQVHTASSTSQS